MPISAQIRWYNRDTMTKPYAEKKTSSTSRASQSLTDELQNKMRSKLLDNTPAVRKKSESVEASYDDMTAANQEKFIHKKSGLKKQGTVTSDIIQQNLFAFNIEHSRKLREQLKDKGIQHKNPMRSIKRVKPR